MDAAYIYQRNDMAAAYEDIHLPVQWHDYTAYRTHLPVQWHGRSTFTSAMTRPQYIYQRNDTAAV